MKDTSADTAAKKRILASVVNKLKKKYGENVLLDPSVITNYDVISSGSMLFDKDSGIGGIARGKVVEVYGDEASGKCLVKDTYIKTSNGLLTIEEIFEAVGENCSEKVSEKAIKYPLYNEFNNIENTTHFTCNGVKDVVEITTRTGNKIKSTKNHPLRVIDTEGNIVWKNTEDLVLGDYLVSVKTPKSMLNISSNNIEEDLEAELLGYLVADGCFSNTNRIGFTNTDVDVYKRYIEIINILYPDIKVKTYEFNNNPKEHQIQNKKFCIEFYDKFELKYPGLAKDKYIPLCIRQGNLNRKKEFIRAFIELESSLDKDSSGNISTIETSSASFKLMFELKQILFQYFGITSFLKSKEVKLKTWEKSKTYWKLSIFGDDLDLYLSMIGYRTEARKETLKNYSKPDYRNTNYNSIPNMRLVANQYKNSLKHGCSYSPKFGTKRDTNLTFNSWNKFKLSIQENDGDLTIRNLIDSYFENYIFDEIKNLELIKDQPTFDFSMEESASFIANGIASHNTSLASCLCANAQERYPDDMVLFVDIEHALDLDYMRSFGVNTDPEKFILAQPSSIEEALTIMEDMCESGLFSLIVLDSVGAALTEDQLAKGMDENTMGSLAKRMSVGTNKLKTVASDTNTAILFINQTYASMSMYGGNVTKGGKALRYVASMRIQVSKKDLIASVDDKEEVVGQGLAYKFIKNKLAPPYKKGETLLYFGKGFDKFTEIIDLSIEFGFIKQGGPWYTFQSASGDEIKFQGKDRVKDFMKNSPTDFNHYEKIVRDVLERKDQAGKLTSEEIAAIEAQEALDLLEAEKQTNKKSKTDKK